MSGESISHDGEAGVVLASTSPYRKALLDRLGLPFRCRAPLVDEETLKDPAMRPVELVAFLARAKGASLLGTEPPSTIVIGGDQLLAFDGEPIGKSGSRAGAIAQLSRLSGRTHELLTAIAVWRDNEVIEHLDVARLTMRALSLAEIERYVDADAPWDCAGSYKLECRGISLFERVESEDQSAITGLPMIALSKILRRFGVAVP